MAKYHNRHHVGRISIYKKTTKSRYWQAYYRDNAGKQKTKSLKTTNIKVAKEEAYKIDRLLQQGDEGRLDALRRNKTVTFGEVLSRFMGECENGPRGPGAQWAETTRRSTAQF